MNIPPKISPKKVNKVEIAKDKASVEDKKNTSRRLLNLRLGIEARKNNADWAEVKEKLKIKPAEISAKLKAREWSLQHLQEINRKIEEAEKLIFAGKFKLEYEVGQEIRKRIKAKLGKEAETLSREKLEKELEAIRSELSIIYPDLKNDAEWKNIKQDVIGGLKVLGFLKNVDWEKPETFWGSVKKFGGDTWKRVKEHPFLAAGFLIAGIAAINFLTKKDKGLLDYPLAAVSAGAATWLGFSFFSSDLPKSAVSEGGIVHKTLVSMVGADVVNAVTNPEKTLRNNLPTEMGNVLLGVEKSAENNDVSGVKRGIEGLNQAAEDSDSRVIIQPKEDGELGIFIIPKGVGKIINFNFQLTKAAVKDLTGWIVKPEHPWWVQGSKMIIDFAAFIPAAGAAVGGVGGIVNAIRYNFKADVGVLTKIKRTPGAMVKGYLGGTVKGAYKSFFFHKWPEMFRYNKAAVENIFLYNRLTRPLDEAALKIYYESKLGLLRRQQLNSSWLSKKHSNLLNQAFKDVEETARGKGIIIEDPRINLKAKTAQELWNQAHDERSGYHNEKGYANEAIEREQAKVEKKTNLRGKEARTQAIRNLEERRQNQLKKKFRRGVKKTVDKTKGRIETKFLKIKQAAAPTITEGSIITRSLRPDAVRYRVIGILDDSKKIKIVSLNTGKSSTIAIEKATLEAKFLRSTKGNGAWYRYKGGQFYLSEGEIMRGNGKNISKICEEKFLKSLKVDGMRMKMFSREGFKIRMIKGEQLEFRINGKWTANPEGAGMNIEKTKAAYLKELQKNGEAFKGFAEIRNPKLLKFWGVLSESAGPALAAYYIYHLDSASPEEKGRVLIETGVSFGAIWAGMKAVDFKIGKHLNPRARAVVNIIGGLGMALGVTQPISDLIEAFIPEFVGDKQVYGELVDVVELQMLRKMFIRLSTKATTKLLTRSIEKPGMTKIGSLLTKKLTGTLGKKITQYTSKSFYKRLAVSLGLRGTVTSVLIADNATVIGVINDVIAAGLLVWMAKDIAELIAIAKKAADVNSEMEKRNALEIEKIEITDPRSRKELENQFKLRYGEKYESFTYEEILNQASPKEIMDIVAMSGDIYIKIFRKGIRGSEAYHFVKGEPWGVKIVNENNEIVELTDKDLTEKIKFPPPQDFEMWPIDVNEPNEEKLNANYRMAIRFIKSECSWTRMDFKLLNRNQIMIKRLDGKENILVSDDGNGWNLNGTNLRLNRDMKGRATVKESTEIGVKEKGLNFFQAVALANLVNRVRGIVRKEEYTPGSDKPFEMDGDDIDLDKGGSPFDLTVFNSNTGWLKFYEKKLGISKEVIVETLNKSVFPNKQNNILRMPKREILPEQHEKAA